MLPVSQYEALLAEVRSLRRKAQRVQELATPLITNFPTTFTNNVHEQQIKQNELKVVNHHQPLDYTMESLILDMHDSPAATYYDGIASSSAEGDTTCSEDEGGNKSTHLSVSSEPISHCNRRVDVSSLYHGTWPVERSMWNSEPTNLRPSTVDTCKHSDMTSVMSFASSSGAAPLDRVLGSMDRSQQLEAKVDMVYSLLSMLGSQEHADMGETLLALSTNPESCFAMRQSGCIPLLVQLVQSDRDVETRTKASQALQNLINSQPDERLKKRESRVFKLLEHTRLYVEALKTNSEFLLETSSSSEDNDPHPVQTIAHLMKLSFDEGHRQAICQLGGIFVIASLVEVEHTLHGSTTDEAHCVLMRRYACMALTNLTFGDSGNKALLCSFREFMRALVIQLQNSSDELRQVTASVLRNLSWRADTVSKEILREVGTVTGLMKSAMITNKENTLKSILSALWNLSAHCTENKSEICAIEGALAFLVSMLMYKTPSKSLAIIENSGGILRNISSQIAVRDDYREILRKHNCLQILLDQLKSPSLTIVSNACGTLWNLSAKCSVDQDMLWQMGAPAMLRSLNHSKHKMIAMGSSAALKNLLSSRPSHPLMPQMDSTARAMDLPVLPTLRARKQKALLQDLDENLTETFENIEKDSPTKTNDKLLFERADKYIANNDVLLKSNKNKRVLRSDSEECVSHKELVYESRISKSDTSIRTNGEQFSNVYSNLKLSESSSYQKESKLHRPSTNFTKKNKKQKHTSIPVRNYFDSAFESESNSEEFDRTNKFGRNTEEYVDQDFDLTIDYSLQYAESAKNSIDYKKDSDYSQIVPSDYPVNSRLFTYVNRNVDKTSGTVSLDDEKDHCSIEDISDNEVQSKIANNDIVKEETNEGSSVKSNVEQTLRIFSRSSSLTSLDGIENPCISDEVNSFISDVSNFRSGIASPSDSPIPPVPPSPKPRKTIPEYSSKLKTSAELRPQPAPRTLQKFSGLEDSTSHSDEVEHFDVKNPFRETDEKQDLEKIEKVVLADSSEIFEDKKDEDMLAACISIGMHNKRHSVQKQTSPSSKIPSPFNKNCNKTPNRPSSGIPLPKTGSSSRTSLIPSSTCGIKQTSYSNEIENAQSDYSSKTSLKSEELLSSSDIKKQISLEQTVLKNSQFKCSDNIPQLDLLEAECVINQLDGNYPLETSEMNVNIDIPEKETISADLDDNLLTKVIKSGYDKTFDDILEYSFDNSASIEKSYSNSNNCINLDIECNSVTKGVDNRMLDPDAMIESLDRFTAELVSQASSHLENKDENKYMTSITEGGGNTWNDTSNDITFPSISGSAPNVLTFKSESDAIIVEDVVDGKEEQKSNDFSSINTTSTLTESTLIAMEATKMATAFKNEADMSLSITSAASFELDSIEPPSNLNSLTSSAFCAEKKSTRIISRKKSLPTGLMFRKALSNNINQASSLESLENHSLSNLDHINPPSVMAELLDMDMEGSMTSVASLTSEVADIKPEFVMNNSEINHPNPIFAIKQPLNALIMEGNINSISDLENINPPSLFQEITDMCNSLADVATDAIGSETELFEDCFTHVIDTTCDVTEFSDANSITPIQSDFSSSNESTPKKSKNLNKSLTPKQRRNLAKERYKTYTVAAEMVMKENDGKLNEDLNSDSVTEDFKTVDGFTESGDDGILKKSSSSKLTPKERRQMDRSRFQTRVLDESITSALNNIPADVSCNELSISQGSSKIRRNFTQKRLENKDRFKTQTLSESTLSASLSPSINSENKTDLHYLVQKEANLVLKTLKETKSTNDELLDCETLSLVSNDDDSEVNSGNSMNYRTYHKSWGIKSNNIPVIQSTTTSSSVNLLNESKNENKCIGKPKILKPGEKSASACNDEGQSKGIKGRRKPLYTKTTNISKPPPPKSIKTSNLVKNVTSTFKSSVVKPTVKTQGLKPPSGYGRTITVKNGVNNNANKNGANAKSLLERQGTFTKEDTTVPKSKIPTAGITKIPASRIAKPIISNQPKTASRKGVVKSASSDRGTAIKTSPVRQFRSPSADGREFAAGRIQNSSSSQSLKGESGRLQKRSSIPNAAATRSNSNSSLHSNSSNNVKKQVTSKIASLWEKIEETKKQQPQKKDSRVWIGKNIRDETDTKLIRSNTFDDGKSVVLRNKKGQNNEIPERITQMNSFIEDAGTNGSGTRITNAPPEVTLR